MLRRGENELVTQIRDALGTDRFDEMFASGSRLSRQQALAVAYNQDGADPRPS